MSFKISSLKIEMSKEINVTKYEADTQDEIEIDSFNETNYVQRELTISKRAQMPENYY